MARTIRNHSIRARGVAVGLAVVAAAAACTEPGPVVTETPTLAVSATPTAAAVPSPSPTPLTDAELLARLPPGAELPDVQGAIITAVFFLKQYPIVYETGDLRVWNALSGPDCVFCGSVRAGVEEIFADGAFLTGGAMNIDELRTVASANLDDGFTYVSLHVDIDPTTRNLASGELEPEGDGGPGVVHLRMDLQGGMWRVSDVGLEEV